MSLRQLRRHVGRLAVVGFSGHTVSGDLRRLASAFDLAGVIYHSGNVLEPRQLAELSREVAGLARDWPLWISVDQEGGRALRLKAPFTEWPPMLTLGRSGDAALAGRFAGALAVELRAVGINVNYAPVLDLHSNPANAAIGDRALSGRPEEAARLGRAIVRGLQAEGVAACPAHFPGLGDMRVGDQNELPVIEHGPDRLSAMELVPFRAAIEEEAALIMTGHVLVPCLDELRPASLSAAAVSSLLKDKLGHRGPVITDDLNTKSMARTHALSESAVDAIAAGSDLVLLGEASVDAQVAALEALIRATESGAMSERRVDDALARQRRVKERFAAVRPPGPAPLETIGCAAHQAVAREMARWL